MKKKNGNKNGVPQGRKMETDRFVLQAIERLRTEKSRGIHTVYSGFNQAFRIYYNGADPVKAVQKLVDSGVVALRLVRGGAMIYAIGDAPMSLLQAQEPTKILLTIIR